MKVSELIAALKQQMRENGDLEVVYPNTLVDELEIVRGMAVIPAFVDDRFSQKVFGHTPLANQDKSDHKHVLVLSDGVQE
jgi:hypothetical protein